MIKKMAKILLPWFVIPRICALFTPLSMLSINQMGAATMASVSTANQVWNWPVQFVTLFAVIGLVLSAIFQEKGNLKAGLGFHIGSLASSMGMLIIFCMMTLVIPKSFMLIYASPAEIIGTGSAYLRAFSITLLILTQIFLLIGQLLMRRPSLLATLIVAGVLITFSVLGLFLCIYARLGLSFIAILEGMKQAVSLVLPFAFIPIRGFYGFFAPAQPQPVYMPPQTGSLTE